MIRQPMTSRRIVILVLLAFYVVFLLDLALLQFPSTNPRPNVLPLHSIIRDLRHGDRDLIVNFLGNLVAFLPIGLIPPLARPRATAAWHVAVFALTLSALIEGLQYASGRRVADIDDLILNTLGALLGYFTLRWTCLRGIIKNSV